MDKLEGNRDVQRKEKGNRTMIRERIEISLHVEIETNEGR